MAHKQAHRLHRQLGAAQDDVGHLAHLQLEFVTSNRVMALAVFCIWSMASSSWPIRSLMSPRSNGVMKRAAHAQQHIAGDRVGLVLMGHDAAAGLGHAGAAFQQVAQRDGALHQGAGMGVEKGEELSPRAASRPGKNAALKTPVWPLDCYALNGASSGRRLRRKSQ